MRDRSKLEKKDKRHVDVSWSEKKTKSAKSQRVGQVAKQKRDKQLKAKQAEKANA